MTPNQTGPRIISVASPKGGVSKTTVATSIASGAVALGQRTLLVDADDQLLSGADEWMQRVEEANDPLPAVMPEHATAFDLPTLASIPELTPYDVVVIDTPPRLSSEILNAVLEMSHFVVAVTTPRDTDLAPALKLMQHVEAIGGLPKTMIGFGMVDTLRAGMRTAAESRAMFAEAGYQCLNSELRSYAAVARAITNGCLPTMYVGPSADRANADAIALTVEVLQEAGVAVHLDAVDAFFATQGLALNDVPFARTPILATGPTQ